MSIAVATDDVDEEALPSRERSRSRAKRIVVAYGFWIFLLSDIVMFSALFAAYAVLVARDRRRTDRRAAVQPTQRRDRDRLPARFELHLRTDVAGGQCAPPAPALISCAVVTFVLGAAFLAWKSANSPA